MRLYFLLLLFAGSVFYGWIAFVDLPFLTSSGRLGPGFFPRILGTGLLALTLWSLAEEIVARRRLAGSAEIGMNRAVAAMMGLGLAYLAALSLLGGVPATVLFLFAALCVFNPGEWLRNILVAIGVPAAVYALFVLLLNADMPRGLLPLPF
ncbi:tripartite tricarboxylate transporter TctB family protein [Salipiger sp. H15]|uniref:Tripartite tricarboxylate transporter TctB family protein n=1 Tax=Alloyangia sp. H15 TaxID=3029062 RepID=A0AAU8AQ28_9RHOB